MNYSNLRLMLKISYAARLHIGLSLSHFGTIHSWNERRSLESLFWGFNVVQARLLIFVSIERAHGSFISEINGKHGPIWYHFWDIRRLAAPTHQLELVTGGAP